MPKSQQDSVPMNVELIYFAMKKEHGLAERSSYGQPWRLHTIIHLQIPPRMTQIPRTGLNN